MIPVRVELQIQIGVQPSVGCSMVFEMHLVVDVQNPVVDVVERSIHAFRQAVVVVVPHKNLLVSHFHVSSEVMQG
eukprot:12091699-Prorocentrum_lima.AAC.1